MKCIFWILATIFFGNHIINASSDNLITLKERNALISFYNSTNGDKWNNNNGWKVPPLEEDGFSKRGSENKWNGITIKKPYKIDEVHVTDIYLEDQNLTGSIPKEIGDLQYLISIRLNNNNITGELPFTLGNLKRLQVMEISGNDVTGVIPSAIGLMKSLLYLRLMNNKLYGTIPKEICNLSNLTHLWLSNNHLSGEIPREIKDMKKLMILALNNNYLTGEIPSEVFKLENLYAFNVSNNLLTGSIPDLPDSYVPRPGSIDFIVHDNYLTGTIPNTFSKFYIRSSLGFNMLVFQEEGIDSNPYSAFSAGRSDNLLPPNYLTQTTAPENLNVINKKKNLIISWTPIKTIFKNGYYIISFGTDKEKMNMVSTCNLTDSHIEVILNEKGLYYIFIQTYTASHWGNNENKYWQREGKLSAPSKIIAINIE